MIQVGSAQAEVMQIVFCYETLTLWDHDFQGESHFGPFPLVTFDVKGDFPN